MLNRYNSLFPLWAVLLPLWAYGQPELFSPYASAIVPMLSLASYRRAQAAEAGVKASPSHRVES